jgi:hypothetical protein
MRQLMQNLLGSDLAPDICRSFGDFSKREQARMRA